MFIEISGEQISAEIVSSVIVCSRNSLFNILYNMEDGGTLEETFIKKSDRDLKYKKVLEIIKKLNRKRKGD